MSTTTSTPLPVSALHSPEWFDLAFAATSPSVQADPVPPALRTLSEALCRLFGIRGVCDPMYIVNCTAEKLGMGDGRGKFTSQQLPRNAVDQVPAIADFVASAYSTCVAQSMGYYGANAKDRIQEIILAALPVLPMERAPLPISRKPTLAISSDLRTACHTVLDHAWEHQIDLSPLVVEERYPGRVHPERQPGSTYAVQFMAEAAPHLSRVLPGSLKNIAAFIVDLNSLQTFAAPGRPYIVTEGCYLVDASDQFALALVDKFADSPMLSDSALEYDRDPEGEGLSAQQARLQSIQNMIGAESILTVMQVLNVQLPADAAADVPVTPLG